MICWRRRRPVDARCLRASRLVELVVQSKLGGVDAVESMVRAERRSRSSATAMSAHLMALVQIQEQIFHLHRPIAGKGPFDAAARHQERARLAVAGAQQGGATWRHTAGIRDYLFELRETKPDLAIEERAIGGPTGAARDGAVPVADHGLVESVVVEGSAVGVGRGCAQAHVAGFGFGAEDD